MKRIIYCIALLPLCLFAAKEIPQPKKPKAKSTPSKAVPIEKGTNSIIFIEAQDRSDDFIQAFQTLKKDKPSATVSAHLKNGKTVMNVLEIHPMSKGTLLLLKVAVPQGTEMQIVSIDELARFSHS